MLLTAVALAVGLLAGRVLRRPHRHLAEPPLRLLPVLIVGLALQVLARPLDVAALLPLSYAALAAFVVLNLRLVGMPIVLIGLGLNLFSITANGGMPVSGDALVAAGLADEHELPQLRLEGGRHLADDGDVLPGLGDSVPVSPLRQVVSFGDLILLVGIADVVAHLSRRRDPRKPRPDTNQPHRVGPESVMLGPVIRVDGPGSAVVPLAEGVQATVPDDAVRLLVASASRTS